MSVTSITDIRQYLTFQLSEEVFAIDVSHVRGVLGIHDRHKGAEDP